MDAAEYKHVVQGLIFLKYISDKFEERYRELEAEPCAYPFCRFIRKKPEAFSNARWCEPKPKRKGEEAT